MFKTLFESLLTPPVKDRSYYPRTTVAEETVSVDGNLVTRHVIVPFQPIDRSLDAESFSLAQSVARDVNLDPVGNYFSQSTEEFASAIDSYPNSDKNVES